MLRLWTHGHDPHPLAFLLKAARLADTILFLECLLPLFLLVKSLLFKRSAGAKVAGLIGQFSANNGGAYLGSATLTNAYAGGKVSLADGAAGSVGGVIGVRSGNNVSFTNVYWNTDWSTNGGAATAIGDDLSFNTGSTGFSAAQVTADGLARFIPSGSTIWSTRAGGELPRHAPSGPWRQAGASRGSGLEALPTHGLLRRC